MSTYLSIRDKRLKRLYDKAEKLDIPEPDRELVKGMLRIAYAEGKNA